MHTNLEFVNPEKKENYFLSMLLCKCVICKNLRGNVLNMWIMLFVPVMRLIVLQNSHFFGLIKIDTNITCNNATIRIVVARTIVATPQWPISISICRFGEMCIQTVYKLRLMIEVLVSPTRTCCFLQRILLFPFIHDVLSKGDCDQYILSGN